MTNAITSTFTINETEHTMRSLNALDRIRIAGMVGRQKFMKTFDPELLEKFAQIEKKPQEEWASKDKKVAFEFASVLNSNLLTLIAAEQKEFFGLLSALTGVDEKTIMTLHEDDFDSMFKSFKEIGGVAAFTKSVMSLNN
ncbi:hypothetical protein COI97_16080 [Bacillus cereus]|nr:hypothetical protein COI97_16080 [Bacillus cereus]